MGQLPTTLRIRPCLTVKSGSENSHTYQTCGSSSNLADRIKTVHRIYPSNRASQFRSGPTPFASDLYLYRPNLRPYLPLAIAILGFSFHSLLSLSSLITTNLLSRAVKVKKNLLLLLRSCT
ncbi:hypothetical protein ACLOJK_013261 [Asimina triloba]